MTRKATFFIETSAEQKAEWKAICAARADLAKREKSLLEEAKSDPRIGMAKKLGDYTCPEVDIAMHPHGQSFCVTFTIAEKRVDDGKATPAPAKPQSPRVYLDPKTLNLLLNSKMLTDEQKVALLCRIDAGLEDVLQSSSTKGGAA